MGKSQRKTKPLHEVLRLTKKNLRKRDTLHSSETKRLGSPKGYIPPAEKIYRFSSKNSPRTQTINFVNSALDLKGVMKNQIHRPTMPSVPDKKLLPWTFDKPPPPVQNEKYTGKTYKVRSEDIKERTSSNEPGPPPIVQKSRTQKKEKQRVERETPIQQSRRLRGAFYHQSYIQELNTKHPDESHTEFHKRKGVGLTYYMALANQLKNAPQSKCEKTGEFDCGIQGGKKKKRKRKTKKRHRTKQRRKTRHRTKRRVKKHRKRKTLRR